MLFNNMSLNKRTRLPAVEHPNKRNTYRTEQSPSLDSKCNNEFLPGHYFSLALVLLDGSKAELFKNEKDAHISELFKHAEILSNDKDALQNTFEKITSIFETDNLQLNLLQCNSHFSEERDYFFVNSTLKCLQDSTSKIHELFKLHKTQEHILQQILFENVPFARLFPLFHLMYHPTKMNIVSSPEIFYIADEEELGSSSILDMKKKQYAYSRLQEDYNATIPSENIFQEDRVNTDSEEQRFGVSKIKEQSSIALKEPIKTIPNYSDLTLAELRASLKKYGYKGSNNRQQMIQKLENIWSSMHGSIYQSQQKTPNDILNANIVRHIKTYKPDIWQKIVNYQNIDSNVCFEGLDCKKSELRAFLDEYVNTLENS
ncbi:unnamed protein product [Rhizopus stolonifer]